MPIPTIGIVHSSQLAKQRQTQEAANPTPQHNSTNPEATQSSTQKTAQSIVQAGYNEIAGRYLEWSLRLEAVTTHSCRTIYLQKFLSRLPEHADILELGCGAGVPWTQMLVAHGANVTGNDISETQIALAKERVPEAKLIHADMLTLEFPSETFDGVVAFYSVIHLPREEQGVIIERVMDWLKPGGYLVLNLGVTDDPGRVNEEWLGARMYFSGYDAERNREIVRQAGFELIYAEVIEDDEEGVKVSFLWILARKAQRAA